VDTQRFRTDGDRCTKNGVLTIVFVGQLIPEKGVDLLIEAVRRISARSDQRLFLKVAGEGHLRSALERLAAEVLPGQVEFLGQVVDVPTLFRSADLAVFPSRWQEAFGFVVAEAMACGIPVIASDAGGIPEVVGHDGRAGLVFRNGDVDDLERQIRFLILDPKRRARMRKTARERVEQEFSIARMVEQYASLYEELANLSVSARKGTTLGDQWVPAERLRRDPFDHAQGSSQLLGSVAARRGDRPADVGEMSH
jgi:glycosyltransferase involved in cell wall biosynthesis